MLPALHVARTVSHVGDVYDRIYGLQSAPPAGRMTLWLLAHRKPTRIAPRAALGRWSGGHTSPLARGTSRAAGMGYN